MGFTQNQTGHLAEHDRIAQQLSVAVNTTGLADAITAERVTQSATIGTAIAAAPFAPPSAYNLTPASLRKSRAKLGAAIAGLGYFDILAIGDSVSAGTGSSGVISTHSFSSRLQSLLIARGVPDGGTGWVWPAQNITAPASPDPRWVRAGGFAPYLVGGSPATSGFLSSTTLGATCSFTSLKTGTSLSFTFGTNTSGFRYRIDGGAWNTTATGGAAGWSRIEVTGLADATHKIEFEDTSGSFVLIGPVRVSKPSGIRVSNAAVGGASSDTWWSLAQWFQNGPATRYIAPDVDLILVESMMINDASVPLDPENAHRQRLADIVNYFKGASGAPEIILWIPARSSMDPALFDRYRAVAKIIALETGVPLIDMSDRFGTYAQATALGMMFDTAHPSSAGYVDIASAFLSLLVP